MKSFKEFVNEAKLQLVEPAVEARFSAQQEQLDDCFRLGQNVAQLVIDDKT